MPFQPVKRVREIENDEDAKTLIACCREAAEADLTPPLAKRFCDVLEKQGMFDMARFFADSDRKLMRLYQAQFQKAFNGVKVARLYQRRHNKIWPELAQVLKEAGISNYSIFLEESTGRLFAFQEQVSPDQAAALPQNEVVQRWWASMAPLMETHADNAPVTVPLQEVFRLE